MSRIILKLSGEALAGPKSMGFDENTVRGVAKQVRQLIDAGYEVGVVTGGGNFWRGRTGNEIDRVKADQIGMLATVMNCIYVSEIFRTEGMKTVVMTPFAVGAFTELFSKDKANQYFAGGTVVFYAGGTGHPYFSTDTGILLRAIESEADMILLAKNVDGIYDSDPAKNPDAKRFDTISIDEVIARGLQAVDMTASILAKEELQNLRRAGEIKNREVIMSSERVKPYEERMEKTISHLQTDLQAVRAGRANPHVLDKIRVDYYGSPTPIQQVANVSVPEARIIQIAPWEKKMIKEISRAINASDIGINPTNDGQTIRLVFPELTGERRKQLSKDVKKMGEDSKVALRNIRRDGNDTFKKLKKTEDLSEDVVEELQDELQKSTEKYIKKIDKMIEDKTKEIMTL